MRFGEKNDTIVALSTAPGSAAIAVIRLSGPEALTLPGKTFPRELDKEASHTLHFGPLRDEQGNLIDEVVIGVFKKPHSYTREDVLEVSCHGSPFIVRQVLELFIRLGARQAEPGEFTMRAFLHGRFDLSQAEAVADLIASQSASAHKLALQQLRGGISSEIRSLRSQLIDFASLLELELDFSEEDVEFADRAELKILVEKILSVVRALLQSFQLGNAIKRGVTTVIAGRPNAGKSTLLNALLREERAIVSDIAGTTRDTIEEVLNIHGVEFRLVDTAGIREAHDQIEAIGVEKTMQKIAQSSVVLFIFDVSSSPLEEVRTDLERLEISKIPVLIIANKVDLIDLSSLEASHLWQELSSPYQVLPISALHKEGLESLKDTLYHLIVRQDIAQDQAIVSNTRHYSALRRTEESLYAVLTGLAEGMTNDLIALDLRQALHYLGEITGEVTTDEILGNIFGKFCIGK